MSDTFIYNLIDFIHESPTMFHAVAASRKQLNACGFTFLDPKAAWELKKGQGYYTTCNDSSLIAFSVTDTAIETNGFRIVGAHTDVPGFKVKHHPEMTSHSYIKLNTEVYGGPIHNTWLDRPLSLAGRVSLRNENPLTPDNRLIDLEKPMIIIPNLAIHMNREVNNGVKFNLQKETLPILAYVEENISGEHLLQAVADKLNVCPTDILNMELFLYPCEKGCVVGLFDQFISSPRLDDLSMVYCGLKGLITATPKTGLQVLCLFDNEEVGSRTKQGADSPLLDHVLERISLSLGKTREDYLRALNQSFMISADVAHLLHPNYPEKSDPTNEVLPGKGPAIKVSANCSYTTDSDSFAVFAGICQQHNIPYQVFVNRSDERGGSTIGPVSASHVNIRTLDIGTPMLSMHSARELMATADVLATYESLKAFYCL